MNTKKKPEMNAEVFQFSFQVITEAPMSLNHACDFLRMYQLHKTTTFDNLCRALFFELEKENKFEVADLQELYKTTLTLRRNVRRILALYACIDDNERKQTLQALNATLLSFDKLKDWYLKTGFFSK